MSDETADMSAFEADLADDPALRELVESLDKVEPPSESNRLVERAAIQILKGFSGACKDAMTMFGLSGDEAVAMSKLAIEMMDREHQILTFVGKGDFDGARARLAELPCIELERAALAFAIDETERLMDERGGGDF